MARNAKIERKNGKVIITVDEGVILAKAGSLTKPTKEYPNGKPRAHNLLATTGGFEFTDDIGVSLNVVRREPEPMEGQTA